MFDLKNKTKSIRLDLDHRLMTCRKAYADYADFCFKTFGDRVKNWFTFNEPWVVAALGYDDGTFAPGRCTNCSSGGNSATEPYIVAHNLILSHAAAVKRYRDKYQAKQKGRIGILLDFVWYEALTNSTADQAAAQRARDFHVGWFLHPIIYGEYPKTLQEIVRERLPKFTEEEVKMVKGSIDYVGINQYTTYYMYDPHQPEPQKPTSYANDWHVGYAYERNGVPVGPRVILSMLILDRDDIIIVLKAEVYLTLFSKNCNFNVFDSFYLLKQDKLVVLNEKELQQNLQAHSNWLYIVPWGMYKAVSYVKEHYCNPTVLLSENGMDDPGNITLPNGLHDTTRINYYKSYITELKKAIDDGANVIGYFAWSMLDNFEWKSGYTSRFGIVYIDFTTLKRYPKMSAYWFREMLKRKN